MKHIVVLGAGTGGMPAAYELRNKLGAEHRISPEGRLELGPIRVLVLGDAPGVELLFATPPDTTTSRCCCCSWACCR